MLLWGGFVVCLPTQMMVLWLADVDFNGSALEKLWLMFIPSMLFALLIDLEILIQCKIYKPIAFKKSTKASI
jgi:hypothetical protein